MGGSGGGGSSGNYWESAGDRPGSPETDCMHLRVETTLQQPVTAPVHRIGTVFELMRVTSGQAIVIAAIDPSGEIVGTVTEHLPDLRRCTSKGVAYVADVVSVTAGIHTVFIRASDIAIVDWAVFTSPAGSHTTAAAVTLEPDVAALDARVMVGTLELERSNLCELRSLMRVGVEFRANVEPSGRVSLSSS